MESFVGQSDQSPHLIQRAEPSEGCGKTQLSHTMSVICQVRHPHGYTRLCHDAKKKRPATAAKGSMVRSPGFGQHSAEQLTSQRVWEGPKARSGDLSGDDGKVDHFILTLVRLRT